MIMHAAHDTTGAQHRRNWTLLATVMPFKGPVTVAQPLSKSLLVRFIIMPFTLPIMKSKWLVLDLGSTSVGFHAGEP